MMSNVNENTPSEATRVTDPGTRSFVSAPRPLAWYPMYVTYARELDVQEALNKAGVENFLPMEHIVMRVGKKIVEREQPAIHNLIFLHSDRDP